MMTDESLLEWAVGWCAEYSPSGEPDQKARFKAALANELWQRRQALVTIHDLATCRLAEKPTDANVVHDLQEIARISSEPEHIP